jgi:predicted nuclease with TOPRIM domain
MSENIGQRGDAYLAKLNAENIPAWARGMSLLLTGLVGFILALGLNFGDIVNRYMDSRNQIETTALSQSGQLEVNALTGLIDSNKGLSQHVTDLILSINTLINENKRLSESNGELNQQLTDLMQNKAVQDELIKQLTTENQDLKTRLELKQ